jgi:hypothetical protein
VSGLSVKKIMSQFIYHVYIFLRVYQLAKYTLNSIMTLRLFNVRLPPSPALTIPINDSLNNLLMTLRLSNVHSAQPRRSALYRLQGVCVVGVRWEGRRGVDGG